MHQWILKRGSLSFSNLRDQNDNYYILYVNDIYTMNNNVISTRYALNVNNILINDINIATTVKVFTIFL